MFISVQKLSTFEGEGIFSSVVKKSANFQILTEITFLIILNFNRFSVPNIKYGKNMGYSDLLVVGETFDPNYGCSSDCQR